MKLKLLFLCLLVSAGALVSVSTASSGTSPLKATALGPHAVQSAPAQKAGPLAPPAYCSPCLFYSGDLNPAAVSSTALANMDLPGGINSTVYQAIKPDNEWLVSAIIVNEWNGAGGVIDPTATPWEIRTGMGPASGQPGSVYASGTGTGVVVGPTGRNLGEPEYTVKVTLSTPVLLHAGVNYFVNARPQCTNAGNSACTQGFPSEWFLSNVEPAGAPVNHFGPANVDDNNFINSAFFGYNYLQAWPPAPTGPCFAGCDQFSIGLQGTLATGTITVTKQVVSNSLDPGRWDLQVDGTDYATCVGNGGTTGPVTVIAGYHSVGENPCFSGGSYATTITCSTGDVAYNSMELDDIYVGPGDNVTCTIKNQRKLFKVG